MEKVTSGTGEQGAESTHSHVKASIPASWMRAEKYVHYT